MEKKYEGLLRELERELENFAEMGPLERMRSELTTVRTSLGRLREMVLELGFGSQAEEIAFFKLVKPRFYALLVLAAERYGFEMARPLRRGKGMDAFYGRQLDYISRFFEQHAFLYQYYRMGATELDGQYFVRGRADQARLFERFYRVQDDRPVRVPGFGIGLYLVAEILKLHGSEITVQSEPGKGSTFSFALPVALVKFA